MNKELIIIFCLITIMILSINPFFMEWFIEYYFIMLLIINSVLIFKLFQETKVY